jgi:hypothetical protein
LEEKIEEDKAVKKRDHGKLMLEVGQSGKERTFWEIKHAKESDN